MSRVMYFEGKRFREGVLNDVAQQHDGLTSWELRNTAVRHGGDADRNGYIKRDEFEKTAKRIDAHHATHPSCNH